MALSGEPQKGSKAGQVLEALREIGRGSAVDVARRLDIDRGLAGAHLSHLRKKGLVERTGERGAFTWWALDG